MTATTTTKRRLRKLGVAAAAAVTAVTAAGLAFPQPAEAGTNGQQIRFCSYENSTG